MVYVLAPESTHYRCGTDDDFTGAPAADFDRMIWGCRMAGIFFLADDYVDSGKMLDRIPGFKKAATGNGVGPPDL